ncbi:MAG: hypothetical protein HY907_00265 [Deltaproteobacteria bacterium]|nr:hypothetical protein [Deltaproteobacteria bacterium]
MRCWTACVGCLLLGCSGGVGSAGPRPEEAIGAAGAGDEAGGVAPAAGSCPDDESWALVDRLDGWCASFPGECNLHEFPEDYPDQAATGETNGFLGDGLQRLALLGCDVVYQRGFMRYALREEDDLWQMVGGSFAVDHLGPDVVAGILARVHAAPERYLDVFARRFLDRLSTADALADLYPAAFLREVRDAAPARVEELASTLLAACETAIAATPEPADEDSEAGRRLVRLRSQAATLRVLAAGGDPYAPGS